MVVLLVSERDVETLMKGVLGASQIPAKILRSVIEKAEGNPLAVEEIAASLRERRIAIRNEDDVQWVGDATVEFPARIQDIVRARIDRLTEEVKTTLQNAAAIGRQFGATLLAAISDPILEVSLHLATLKQLELVNLLGRIYWIQSNYTQAAQMLERSTEQMRRLGNKGEESTAAATAACVFGLMGRF